MKTRKTYRAGTIASALLALALAALATLHAQEKPSEGWITLFDGSSLDGWKSNEETPGCFTLEDGKLKVSGGRAHLFYVGKDGNASFTDFELKLRIMTTENANSGVYFHTQFQKKGWPEKGYECQVNATHKDPKKTGSLYGISNIYAPGPNKLGDHKPGDRFTDKKTGHNLVAEKAPNTDGQWFDYHIKVQGQKIEIRVDGQTTVEYQQPEKGVAPNRGMPGRVLGSGTIGIQAHDPKSTIYYQNIEIRPLG